MYCNVTITIYDVAMYRNIATPFVT
jgi:hypothetical protein